MKAHNLFFLFLIPLLLTSSCRKDAEEFSNLTTIPDPIVVIVKGNVLGKIVDKNNQAIPNVQITAGQGATTSTDTAGIFFFKDIRLNQKGAYIKAEKEGYFLGSRTFYPQTKSTNYVNIQLIEKEIAGSFSSSQGGPINMLANDVRLDFPANAVINENGQAYEGTVNVLLHWLDPGSEDLNDKMPGDLTGLSLNGEYKVLESYGMLAIELEGSNGEKLNLGNGQQAELSFPLPPDFASRAPATIPLWYFDEDREIWVEEGEAVLEGNHYVGKVSHFSFWNCDDPYTLIKLSGTFIFDVPEGSPLENLTVKIIIQNNGEIGTGQTDHHGFFCGNVPKDEVMILQLLNGCGEVVFSQEIGGFDQDTNLGNIFVTPQSVSIADHFLKIKGSLVDCNNQAITDGMVKIRYAENYQVLYLENDNQFEVVVNICSATSALVIEGISFENGLYSQKVSYSPTNTDTLLDTGPLWICGNTEPDEYFYVQNDSIIGYMSQIQQFPSGTSSRIILSGDGLSSHTQRPTIFSSQHILTIKDLLNGEFEMESLNAEYNNANQGYIPTSVNPGSTDELIITEFGNIGEPIKGYLKLNEYNMMATRISPDSIPFKTPIHILFKVIREF